MDDLRWIKKHYSETLSHLCRELFPNLLEKEGILPKLLEENFAQSASLGADILGQDQKDKFKNFIYSLIDVENNHQIITQKSPEELMSEAGYILYPECKTEADIQSFRHYYYRPGKTPVYKGGTPQYWDGEELCTFNGGRLNSCRVWFAVKKEVAENPKAIKRAKSPTRQDEYGTSVISIQFTKGSYPTLSIKNRYNHSVNNPDNTFNSDLDNIIHGLTHSFAETYSINISQGNKDEFELINYVKASDGKFYRYNMEINNVYYCENNVIIDDFTVKQLDQRYVLMDYFIVDLSNNTIELYDDSLGDSFVSSFDEIKKISLEKDEEKHKVLRIKPKVGEDILITLNEHGEIYKLTNNNLTTCGDDFLSYNNSLISIDLPKLESCTDGFLFYNDSLTSINLPRLQSCGSDFLFSNNTLTSINLPNLENCKDDFLFYNDSLTSINLPKLQSCGNDFLFSNNTLTSINLPNLENCKDDFLFYNNSLTSINLPKLQSCRNGFLYSNKALTSINLPKLIAYGSNFLPHSQIIDRSNLINKL